MRALFFAAIVLASIGPAAAQQGRVTAGEAHVLSAFATGADPLVVAENVKAGPALHAQLGVETDSRGIYEWVVARVSGSRLRATLLTPTEAVSHASLPGVSVSEQLMRLEGGDAAFLVQYSPARKNVTFVEQLSAQTANAPVLKPAAPLAALPPPVPPVPAPAAVVAPRPARTGPRGECVIKPVMSEDDIWNCSETVLPAAVAAPPPVPEPTPEPPVAAQTPPAPATPVAPAAVAPALQPTGECVIKPVMSEQDLRNCAAASAQPSTPILEVPAAPVAAVAAVAAPAPQAASRPSSECIIKPVMSDDELRACAAVRPQRTAVVVDTPAPLVAADRPAQAPPAAPQPARECVIKPVMSEEDLRACATVSTRRTAVLVDIPAAPVVAAERPAQAPPAASQPARECVIRPVMSDDDLRACGIRR